jgi:hypothetical protein
MSRRVVAIGLMAAVLTVLAGSAQVNGFVATHATAERQVRELLELREHAVRSADADAWRQTIDGPAVASQVALFEALDRLELDAWSERLTALESGPDGSWRASVRVRYRFPGEQTDAVVDAVLDVTTQSRIAGWAPAAPSVWDIHGVRIQTGRHSLVVGGEGVPLRAYAAELDRASVSVGQFLNEPPPRLVLVLPQNWDQAVGMLPTRLGAGWAAVTSVLGPPGSEGPVRILADPAVLARLDDPTRSVVFGHEAFHVATPARVSTPRWLAEGLADHAGYRGSDIALDRALSGLLRHARAAGVPETLPPDASFADPRRATWAYEGAHLAVRLLVAEHGAAAVMAFYEAVADGTAIDTAMREILGTDVPSLTAGWRDEVITRAAR